MNSEADFKQTVEIVRVFLRSTTTAQRVSVPAQVCNMILLEHVDICCFLVFLLYIHH